MRLSASTRGGRSPPSPVGGGAPGGRRRRARARGGGRRRGGGHRGSDPPPGEELVQDPRQLHRVCEPDGDQPEIVECNLHVEHSHDLEEARHVGGGVGDDQQVALDDEVAALDERAEGRGDPVGRRVLERDDLGDHLVVAPGGVRLGADDGGQRALADGRRWQDLVEIAGANGGDPIHLEHGQKDVEDLVLGDPARGLDGDLLASHPGPDRVVEPGDLTGGLDDGLDVGVVEVQDDLPTRSGRRCDRPRRRRRLGRRSRSRRDQGRAGRRAG